MCVFYAISTRCVKSIVLILRRRTEEASKGRIKGRKVERIKIGTKLSKNDRMKRGETGIKQVKEREKTSEGHKENMTEVNKRGTNQFH